MRRTTRFITALVALTLVAAACGGDEGGGGGTAAACTQGRLKGLAAGGLNTTDSARVAAAGTLAQAKPVVKIGMFGDLSGANSGLVVPVRNAAQLAVEQRNAKGDLQVTVQFVPVDNKDANPDTAGPIEQRFIDDDAVVGVIGGAFSGETNAVGGRFSSAGLTHITASATNPALTSHGWPFFRAVVTDDVQGKKMANLLAGVGCAKIAVIDDKGDYGKGLADFVEKELKAKNIQVVTRQGIDAKTTDYGPLIDTLSARAPDAVFYGGYYNGGSLLLKQMRERGLNATFACGDGCADKQLVSLAGANNANGSIITCPCVIPFFAGEGTKAAQLQKDYKAKFGIDALIYSAEAYDAANIFLEAIAASDDDGKVTRAEILAFVKGVNGYDGVSRKYTFGSTGELSAESQTINVYPVKDGALQLLGPTETAV